MNGVLFERRVRELDRKFLSERKGVALALVMDKFSRISSYWKFKIIQIAFLNTKHHINNTAYESTRN